MSRGESIPVYAAELRLRLVGKHVGSVYHPTPGFSGTLQKRCLFRGINQIENGHRSFQLGKREPVVFCIGLHPYRGRIDDGLPIHVCKIPSGDDRKPGSGPASGSAFSGFAPEMWSSCQDSGSLCCSRSSSSGTKDYRSFSRGNPQAAFGCRASPCLPDRYSAARKQPCSRRQSPGRRIDLIEKCHYLFLEGNGNAESFASIAFAAG
jgi:hypothetical protein